MATSYSNFVSRQLDDDAEYKRYEHLRDGFRKAYIVLAVAFGLTFLAFIFPALIKSRQRLPAIFAAVASLLSAINYGLSSNLRYPIPLYLAMTITRVLGLSAAFVALYLALERRHWSQYALASFLLPPGFAMMALTIKPESYHRSIYPLLAYDCTVLINIIALFGFAYSGYKASKGADRWAQCTRLFVAPLLFLAALFKLVIDIAYTPLYTHQFAHNFLDKMTYTQVMQLDQSVVGTWMVSLCVSLGLLAYYLNKQALSSKREHSGQTGGGSYHLF